MSLALVNKALESQLRTHWSDPNNIAWDNLNYVPKRGQKFIRTMLDVVDSEPLGMGCRRVYYLLTIQVFTQRNIHSKEALNMADSIVSIYNGFEDASTKLYVSTISASRVGDEEEWYQWNVLVDVTNDE